MPKRFMFSAIVLTALMSLPPLVRAQTAAASGNLSQRKWNNSPPVKADYQGKKSDPAPRRDLSGFWDGTAEGGASKGRS